MLTWCCELDHSAATRLCVQLVASIVKVRKFHTCQGSPRCSIQVWVEGAHRDVRLAVTTGSICPKNSRGAAHVAWLGRPKERPEGHCEVGWRFAEVPEQPAEPEAASSQDEGAHCRRGRTMAQAALGVLAAVARLFGARTVELGAEDTGSGKLVRFYSDLGFTARGLVERVGRPEQRMDAPIEVIAGHAPEAWLARLVPPSFDAWPWLWSAMGEPSIDMVLDSLGVSRQWAWKVSWPLGAGVAVQLDVDDQTCKLTFEAMLRSSKGTELALARCVVRVQQAGLRVMWLGRSHSQGVHPSVQGRSLEGETVLRSAEGGPGGPSLAVALLGVLAVLGRWLDCRTMELTACDDGSGRLLAYLGSLGFVAQGGGKGSLSAGGAALQCGPTALTADCAELAKCCCPEEWRERLPPDAQLSPLGRTVSAPL